MATRAARSVARSRSIRASSVAPAATARCTSWADARRRSRARLEFIATYPKATLSFSPAPCGQPLQVDYLIDQHTAHAAGDWIGIVPVYGEGDSDNLDWTQAVKWARLGDANKGVVEIKSGPMYPGATARTSS